jgi:hypothetical protein
VHDYKPARSLAAKPTAEDGTRLRIRSQEAWGLRCTAGNVEEKESGEIPFAETERGKGCARVDGS